MAARAHALPDAPLRSLSLRGFLTRLIWFSLAPLLLLATLLAADHVRDERATRAAAAQRLAARVAAAVDQQLSASIGALRTLAASSLADDPARWADLYREAQAMRQSFGFQVVFVDGQEHVRFHTGVPFGQPVPALPLAGGRSALHNALETGQPAVGDRFHGPVEDAAIVAIAVPGLRAGKPAFALIGVLPATNLAPRMDEVSDLPAGWSIALHDSAGGEIAHRGPPLSPAGADAQGRFAAATSLAPWTVALEVSQADRLAPLVSAATAMVAAVLGATAAGVLGGAWAGRRLGHSLRSLVSPRQAAPGGREIDEIATVRRMLDQADHARDHAEAARRAADERHRINMEQASLALQVREGLLRGVFDSATDAILTANAQQVIVMANPAAARLFGWTVDDLVGMPLARLVPPRVRERHAQAVQAFGETGESARHMGTGPELAGLRADGSEFPIDAAISHVRVDGQRLYTVILRDITERRRAEQTLRESQARLSAALASMNDAIFITDAEGSFIEFNDAFASFFRFKSKDDCPRAWSDYPALLDLRWPDGRSAPVEQWPARRALRGESAGLAEYHVVRKDSGEAWIGSFSFAPIRDAAGEIVGAVVTGRDITGLRRVQAELEASHADLRRLVAAQDGVQEEERKRIARELHDDLQQTLAAVLMETTVARAAAPALPQAVQGALDTIDRLATAAIVSTRRIVNDLRPQMLEELGLVPALEARAAQFAERTGIACRVEAAGLRLPEGHHAQPATTCLYRVAQEALNNVAKHAGASEVVIRLAQAGPGRVRLQVRDDGCGLVPQDRAKPGTYGLLGMSERVRAAGGTLRIDGDPGAGTTVEAELPLADVDAAADTGMP